MAKHKNQLDKLRIFKGLNKVETECGNMIQRHINSIKNMKLYSRKPKKEDMKAYCIFRDAQIENDETRGIIVEARNNGITFHMIHEGPIHSQKKKDVSKYCTSPKKFKGFDGLRLLATPTEVMIIYSPKEASKEDYTGLRVKDDEKFAKVFREIVKFAIWAKDMGQNITSSRNREQ